MIQTKRTWKLVAVLVAALALAGALLTGCSGNSNSSSANYRTLDQIKDSGKITIGVFSDKSPFGYVDENGNVQKRKKKSSFVKLFHKLLGIEPLEKDERTIVFVEVKTRSSSDMGAARGGDTLQGGQIRDACKGISCRTSLAKRERAI